MRELFQTLLNELQKGRSAELVTIIKSGGSTPRGTGAMMAVFSDGCSIGSIGGGNVEFASQKHAVELLNLQKTEIKSFQFAQGDAANLGMVCGGDVTLQFRYIAATDKNTLSTLQMLLDKIVAEKNNTWLIMDEQALLPLRIVHESDLNKNIPRELLQSKAVSLGQLISIPVVQTSHVFVFGGGHVAQALIPVIASVGFHPVVYDDRPEFANSQLFPQASATICDDFENVKKHISITPDDYVVIMTRGHQADYDVLTTVLRSGAKYIGCIGSRRKLAICQKKLLDAGFTTEEFSKVYAPIGLNIGAETPAEIAVSIAAELISVRAGMNPRQPKLTGSLSGI